jgi:peptidoglycan hydrolase-like protein with peptidoglycan-binding domain
MRGHMRNMVMAALAPTVAVGIAVVGAAHTVEASPSAPSLRQGSSGYGVKCVQVAINYMQNAGLTVDGRFGPATAQAVREYQIRYNLTPDGIVGPQTGDHIYQDGLQAAGLSQSYGTNCYWSVPTTF